MAVKKRSFSMKTSLVLFGLAFIVTFLVLLQGFTMGVCGLEFLSPIVGLFLFLSLIFLLPSLYSSGKGLKMFISLFLIVSLLFLLICFFFQIYPLWILLSFSLVVVVSLILIFRVADVTSKLERWLCYVMCSLSFLAFSLILTRVLFLFSGCYY